MSDLFIFRTNVSRETSHPLYHAVTCMTRASLLNLYRPDIQNAVTTVPWLRRSDFAGCFHKNRSKSGLPGVLSPAAANDSFSHEVTPCLAHIRLLFPINAFILKESLLSLQNKTV